VDIISVHPADVTAHELDGWLIKRIGKFRTRMQRPKKHSALLEDRVWTLTYKMGFGHLSGNGGAHILLNSDDPQSPKNQLDVVAIDDEIALVIECKSKENATKRPLFQNDLAKHILLRDNFAKSIAAQFPMTPRRNVVFAMFTSGIVLTDNDRYRASEQKVVLFDETDLAYYEALVAQVGTAGRFQFLADLLPGKAINGLRLRVPAIRARMGGYTCYTFALRPSYLMKIAYVSQRAKGKASDVDTYQRMMKRSRLAKIRRYISEVGIFPTNIVVSLEGKVSFDKAKQEEGAADGTTMGWLTLSPSYKSAWIIDGQHRLYAYSGHPRADSSLLSVLAFESLPPDKQAEFFIDINAQQTKVNQSLLEELYAELHWEATDPAILTRAIVSKAILGLNIERDSPFFARVKRADDAKTDIRCISLTALYGSLAKTGFYYSTIRKGAVVPDGPLWAGDRMQSLKRTIAVLKSWFLWISERSNGWWDLGSGEGGGLAMNDQVSACVNVLRSVLQHYEARGVKLIGLTDEELIGLLKPFGVALGDYLGSLGSEERREFRSLRGVEGQTRAMRRCQYAISERISDFEPGGLKDFIELERAETNEEARQIIDRVEKLLQATLLDELKYAYGSDEPSWWFEGVPVSVRKSVDNKINEDKGQHGGREDNFTFIDYRDIVEHNWELFKTMLARGASGKQTGTRWINDINEIRKNAMHASRGAPVSYEQLGQLQELESWLRLRLDPRVADREAAGIDQESESVSDGTEPVEP